MPHPDFNLLAALDVLLAERSVAGAAKVLGLSDSAMSRTLLRLRNVTGDPLLVRAGRGLVPTPHAMALGARVRSLTDDVKAVLQPADRSLDVAGLDRVFTIRANEGFVAAFAARIATAITEAAPGVKLRFAPKPDKDVRFLREGSVDLEIGVLGDTGPEIKVQSLYRDQFVGIVRKGHPLARGDVTPARYAAFGHVVTSRRGRTHGPVDTALEALGLQRRVIVVVPDFPAAMAITAASDLVGLVTRSFVRAGRATAAGVDDSPVHDFDLPVPTSAVTVSQMWHPRFHSDPAHGWLRETVLSVCGSHPGADRPGSPPEPEAGARRDREAVAASPQARATG